MLRRALPLTILALAAVTASAQAVTGGRPASRPYPFMVAIEDGGDQFCGGSLVRPDYVLTAAHCIEDTSETQLAAYRAVLGRVHLSETGGEELPIAAYKVHEKYATDPNGGHDVALLKLARPSAATPVRIAGPAERATWNPGATARVIGWGAAIFLVGPGSDGLQEVDVPIVSDDDCQRSYDASPFIFDRETMVCAGELLGLKDSCQGDSGGPLLAGDLAGEPVQVGVVSFGLGCGFPAYYGVYARVAEDPLLAWVTANLPPPGAPAGTAPVAPTSAPAPPAPAPGPAPRTARLRFAKDLGSARLARRRRALRVRVTSTGPVTAITVVLRRGSRLVARARLSRLDGRATLKLPLAPRHARAGKLRLRVTATDAAGRRVTRSGSARLRR